MEKGEGRSQKRKSTANVDIGEREELDDLCVNHNIAYGRERNERSDDQWNVRALTLVQ